MDVPPRSRVRRAALAVLLAAGVALWLGLGWRDAWLPALIVLGATLLAALPPVGRGVTALRERLEATGQDPRSRRAVACVAWAVATLYLSGTAYFHARSLFPRFPDEQSYLIGARMLARGRLWMPQHPLADFFESFYLLVKPVYASIYFPGTALLNVPAVWLRLPSWVIPVLAAGAVVALTYLVVTELVDGAAGLLAAFLVVATTPFRSFSTMLMAQVPSALFGLLIVWAWLRWRRKRTAARAVWIGVFTGWAAVTRPVDALAFALPVGLAILIDLWRGTVGQSRSPAAELEGTSRPSMRGSAGDWMRTIACILLGAAPFFALQVAFDLGVTGRPFKTPYVLYLEQNQPTSVFGWERNPPSTAALTRLPQKLLFNQDLAGWEAEQRQGGVWRWFRGRVEQTLRNTLPWSDPGRSSQQSAPAAGAAPSAAEPSRPGPGPLLALLPVGLLGLTYGRRWVLCAPAPLFVGLYLFNPHYLDHYVVPLAPVMAAWAVIGARVIETARHAPRYRRFMGAFVPIAIVALAAVSLPELNGLVRADPIPDELDLPLLDAVRNQLATIAPPAGPPAVVLFRFHPGSRSHGEPVYNADVTWPDDAPVIRAHDLGPRDVELIRYYAGRQPARVYYLFDRRDGTFTRLGTAADAERALAPSGEPGRR